MMITVVIDATFVSSIHREAALLAAIPPPPRSTRGSHQKVIKYQYVFDQQTEAQQSSAFIGGNKVNKLFTFINSTLFLLNVACEVSHL